MDPKLFTRTYREMVRLFSEDMSDAAKDLAYTWADDVSDAMNGELQNMQGNERCLQISFGAGHRVSGAFIPRSMIPAQFTRGRHERHVAAINTVVAAKLDLPRDKAMAFIFGGLFHDEGYYPFGHSTDYALQAFDPSYLGHEYRVVRTLESPFFMKALNKAGTDANAVLNVIQEKGALGVLQRTTDTAGYCFLDPQALEFYDAWQPDFLPGDTGDALADMIRRFVNSITGVGSGHVLEVECASPLREVLTVRKHLYRHMYYNEHQQLCITALNKMIALALETEVLRVVRFEDACSDDDMSELLRLVFDREELKDYRQWFLNVFSLTDGKLPKDRWSHIGTLTKDNMRLWRESQDPKRLERALCYARRDASITIKEVVVKCGSGYELVSPKSPNEGELFPFKYHVWLPNFVG